MMTFPIAMQDTSKDDTIPTRKNTIYTAPSSTAAASAAVNESLGLLLQNTVMESHDITIIWTKDHDKDDTAANTTTRNVQSQRKRQRHSIQYKYPSVCTPVTDIQESTSTLLTARSYAKANRTDLAWDILRSFFVVQGTNGHLPKYRYTATAKEGTATTGDKSESYYVQNSTLPSIKMFGPPPPLYSPCNPTDHTVDKSNDLNSHTNHPTCYDSNGEYTYVNEINIQSSGRLLSAIPMHATILLEIFYLSNQSIEDVQQLSFYYQRLYHFHSFWMDHLDKQCFDPMVNYDDGRSNNDGTPYNSNVNSKNSNHDEQNDIRINLSKCYNVIHPWGSFIDIHSSSTWKRLLHPIIQQMKQEEWIPKDDMVNKNIVYSIHYPHDDDDNNNDNSNTNRTRSSNIYNAMMYLFECQKNVTISMYDTNHQDLSSPFSKQRNRKTTKTRPKDYESELISKCGFALLDASQIAILSKSNHDLMDIGNILKKRHSKEKPSKMQWKMMEKWLDMGHLLLDSLWNETHGGYLSRFIHFQIEYDNNKAYNTSTTAPTSADFLNDENRHLYDNPTHYNYVFNGTKAIFDPSLGNLLIGWGKLQQGTKFMRSVASPLLDRDGFNCGTYSIWSMEGCLNTQPSLSSLSLLSRPPSIYPLLNYWIYIGLLRNSAFGIGDFIQKATINLMCLAPPSSSLLLENTTSIYTSCQKASFANTYDALSGLPMPNSTLCDLTYTSSAAVLYNMLVEDEDPFHIKPAPPMRDVWIVLLIITELVVAFGIGLSCLFVSLNLLRRLKFDDDETGTGGGAGDMLRPYQSMHTFTDEQDHGNYNDILTTQSLSLLLLNDENGGVSDQKMHHPYQHQQQRQVGEEDNDENPLHQNGTSLRLDEQESFSELAWKYIHYMIPLSSSEQDH